MYFTPSGSNNLVVTCAQAGTTNKTGSVTQDEIYLNHYEGDVDPLDQINQAVDAVDSVLQNEGYTKTYVSDPFSIYHYHGSCTSCVSQYKVNGTNNLYISDMSIVDQTVPGSTSSTALAIGFNVGEVIMSSMESSIVLNQIEFDTSVEGTLVVDSVYQEGKKMIYVGDNTVLFDNSQTKSGAQVTLQCSKIETSNFIDKSFIDSNNYS